MSTDGKALHDRSRDFGGNESVRNVNSPKQVKPAGNRSDWLMDDLAELLVLNEDTILENLVHRFQGDSIYTYTGDILIALNPWKELPIYSEQNSIRYRNAQATDLPPHCFAIADASYRDMIIEDCDQSILVSGESGSGKTETTKFLLQHLAKCSTTVTPENASLRCASRFLEPASCSGIASVRTTHTLEQRILASNPILEAFGNAQTIRNQNSSRYGKFIQLFFHCPTSGAGLSSLIGAEIRIFLLERSRIVHVASSERNYHIFHQLRAAAAVHSTLAAGTSTECRSDNGRGGEWTTTAAAASATAAAALKEAIGDGYGGVLPLFEDISCVDTFRILSEKSSSRTVPSAHVSRSGRGNMASSERSGGSIGGSIGGGDSSPHSTHRQGGTVPAAAANLEYGDVGGFLRTVTAMRAAGLGGGEIAAAFRVAAAVMHLGNVGFRRAEGKNIQDIACLDGGAAACVFTGSGGGGGGCGGSGSGAALAAAAGWLGVDAEALLEALTKRTVRGGARDDSAVAVPLSRRQAEEARDALCRAAYARLFAWIVTRVNETLAGNSAAAASASSVAAAGVCAGKVAPAAAVSPYSDAQAASGGGPHGLHRQFSAGRREGTAAAAAVSALSRSPGAGTALKTVVGGVITRLAAACNACGGVRRIGVLDIFGFEALERNSLEQLCINYANERLQLHFSRAVLMAQRAEYECEGIPWAAAAAGAAITAATTTVRLPGLPLSDGYVGYEDNAGCVELLENRTDGLLALIDEQGRVPGGSAAGLLDRLRRRAPPHPRLAFPRIAPTAGTASASGPAALAGGAAAGLLRPSAGVFTVRHYAGDVIYETEGLLERNRDQLGGSLTDLLMSSGCSFASCLFSKPEGAVADLDVLRSRRGPGRGATGGGGPGRSVVLDFKRQLGELMQQIERTKAHYIRCLNPNPHKAPGAVDRPYLLHQLRCGGVVEAVRVARAAFPARCPYTLLLSRYRSLHPSDVEVFPIGAANHSFSSVRATAAGLDADKMKMKAAAVLASAGVAGDEYVLGATKAFLRRGVLDRLESCRSAARASAASTVAAAVAGALARRCLRRKRRACCEVKAAGMLQAVFRRHQTGQFILAAGSASAVDAGNIAAVWAVLILQANARRLFTMKAYLNLQANVALRRRSHGLQSTRRSASAPRRSLLPATSFSQTVTDLDSVREQRPAEQSCNKAYRDVSLACQKCVRQAPVMNNALEAAKVAESNAAAWKREAERLQAVADTASANSERLRREVEEGKTRESALRIESSRLQQLLQEACHDRDTRRLLHPSDREREYAAQLGVLRQELHRALEDASRWREETRRKTHDPHAILMQKLRDKIEADASSWRMAALSQSEYISKRAGFCFTPGEGRRVGKSGLWVPESPRPDTPRRFHAARMSPASSRAAPEKWNPMSPALSHAAPEKWDLDARASLLRHTTPMREKSASERNAGFFDGSGHRSFALPKD